MSANGVSGTVANPTTTPAITLALGAITPTSIAATGAITSTATITGSNLSGVNTGDQYIVLGGDRILTEASDAILTEGLDGIIVNGDVTGSGTGRIQTTIMPQAVTYDKMQSVSATDRLLGRQSAGAGIVEEIPCTAAGRAILDDATSADQRTTLGAAASGAITASGLTVSANNRLLGRVNSAGAVEEISLGTGLSFTGTTLNATGGTVTSVNADGSTTGMTFSGGPVTGSGTLTLGGTLAVSNGGTGATSAAAALTSLGAYPASNPSGYTSNTGTVTSTSVTTANGVSGTVSNATTTPAITITLGAITPTSVAASGTVTGSNLSGSNTGDQTITLTGDVTGSGTGSFAATIANNAVTFAKVQQIATDKILGRDSSGTGVVEELAVSGGVEFTGSGGIQTSAFTGDVTKAAGGTSQTIASSAVTYAKIQDISAASRLLGRGAGAGAGVTQEISLGTGLSMSGTTLSASAAGTVTSVDASGGSTGMSFSGGPVTTTGTLTLDGTLAVANGGTGATTAAGALTNLGAYPNSNPAGYTSNAGTVTNVSASGGANISVATGSTTPVISQVPATTTQNGYMTSTQAAKLDGIAAGASVTSVGVSGGTTGLTTSGGPITSSGTITLAGTLSVANGGTSSTSAQSAIDFLAGATTNGTYLRGNGTNNVMSAIQAVDLPLIALGSMVSGTLAVTNGGTGQTNSFTNGDLLIGNTTGGTLNKAKLTAGTGITITNGAGSITIANSGSGSGDVTGPSSSTDGTFAIFDGTTGKVIKEASWVQEAGDFIGPTGANNMVDGFVYIPAASSGPSGTPTNVTGLNVPMFFNTNSNTLHIHNGTTWKSVTLT